MMRSLWTSASGMYAQQLNIDTISNNLANVNTIGFKKSRAEFEDLMYLSAVTGRRTGNFHGLVHKIFKLCATFFEADSVHVSKVVRNSINVQLLGVHAGS